jgi:hypothetical protein
MDKAQVLGVDTLLRKKDVLKVFFPTTIRNKMQFFSIFKSGQINNTYDFINKTSKNRMLVPKYT